MDSSLSTFLADVFMDHLENTEILNTNKSEIKLWLKYVDDVFVILQGDTKIANNL